MIPTYKDSATEEMEQDVACEEDIEGRVIQSFLENLENPDNLYTKVLQALDNCSDESIDTILYELKHRQIIERLFGSLQDNNQFLDPFIHILKEVSARSSVDIFADQNLIQFLLSFISPENENINLMSNIATILRNYAKFDPGSASIVTQHGALNRFIQVFPQNIFDNELFENQKDFLIESLSFFNDMLNIPKFYPEREFPAIISIAFSYFQSKNFDVCFQSLDLLIAASSDKNYVHFEPFILPNLPKYDLVLALTNSEDEEISNLALQFLINSTYSTENQYLKLKIFQQLSDNLMTYLTNCLDHYPDNLVEIIELISNFLETNDDEDEDNQEGEEINDQSRYSNYPIFEYFRAWIFDMLLNFDDAGLQIKAKEALADLFSKMALIASTDDIMGFIHQDAFIAKLCSLFFIEDDIDYNLLLALRRMLKVSKLYTEGYETLIGKLSAEIELEEIANLFNEVEDESYIVLRDDVLNLCRDIDEESGFQNQIPASILFTH